MPHRPPPGLRIASVILAAMAMGLAAVGRGQAPPARAGDDPAPNKPAERYFLASTCAQCHSRPEGQRPVPNFAKHTEYRDWLDHDKHSQAFKVLADERSLRMGALLGIDVSKDVKCLNCHAPAVADPRADEDPVAQAERLADGVSCASCHGPRTEWVQEHAAIEGEEKWIARTAEEKRDKFGMNDLRDPASRSRVCASCHVGDVRQHRAVTHAMYAAGHPPLPGLEVATFSEAEPPHWRAMKDVPYLTQSDDDLKKRHGANAPARIARFQALRSQYRVDQFPTQNARLVAVGGVVSFRAALELFAESARADKGAIDFARFDCASCHHDLKASDASFRQARGFPSTPGRPPAADWPSALVSIAIAAGDPAKAGGREAELSDGWKRFRAAVGSRPFGDRTRAIAEARALSAWSDALIADLDASPLDRDAAIRMLRQITSTEPPDHASARQLVWAFRTVYNELNPRPAEDEAIAATIQELMNRLGINLTPGQQGTIEREVGARLDGDDKFDPEAVKRLFDRLAGWIKSS